MRVSLRLLGRFDMLGADGGAVAMPTLSRQERALLAYTTMQPDHGETRERLSAVLWDAQSDSLARQSLRQCLLVLRKKLEAVGPDILTVDRRSVGLNADALDIDVTTFLALAESEDLVDLEKAVACYRGELLERFSLDVEAFDDWLRAERTRVNAVAVGVFERYATRHDALGNGEVALRAAERLVQLAPLDEGAERILLRMLARYRGREAALAQMASFVQTLRTELSVAPEVETLQLAEAIRSGAIAAPEVPSGLPRNAVEPAPTLSTVVPRQAASTRPARSWRLPAAASLVVVALAAGAIIYDLGPAPAPQSQEASSAPARTADPWRSPTPPDMPALDATALANQALYPMVVLPFRPGSADNAIEGRLATRLTADLTGDLSRAPNARVISAQTSRLYGGRDVDIARIGSELGVRYVVEGDLHVEGDALRLNVSLSDATTRLLMWSDRFERPLADRAAVRDELTRAITRRLQINLVALEDRRRPPGGTSEPGLDDLLARGWAATTRISTADKTAGADTYFGKALELDPDNVSALTGLGAFHVVGSAMFLADGRAFDLVLADKMLKRATAIEPNASLAFYYLGVLEKTQARPEAALQAFRRTLEINPSYAPAYAQVGHVLSRIGHLDNALEHVRYAIRLSPKDHNLGTWSLFGGQIELESGRDNSAIEWFSRALDGAPRSPFIHAALAAAYTVRGEPEKAGKHVAETRRLAPWMTDEQMIARLVGLSKPGSEPKRLIGGLRKAFGQS